jgi:hypothetical protein
MMDDKQSLPRGDAFYEHPRFWQAMLVIAIMLNVYVILNSELGLDAHVEGAYVESENGWVLDWGDTRTEDPLASNPDNAKTVDGKNVKADMIMPFAILGMILAIMVASKSGLNRDTMTVLLLNPALIFSIGRGYSEYTYLGILAIAWMAWSQLKESEKPPFLPRLLLIGIASMLMLSIWSLKLKIDPIELLIPFFVLLVAGSLIDQIPGHWLNPKRAMLGGFGIGVFAIITCGLLGIGSFSVVTSEPIRFIQALPISVFGVIIVYGFVGMTLWPFARKTWEGMENSTDRLTGELALFIGTMAGLIVTYVACLWSYESVLWNSAWPWHMWTMGNNGRYITILAIPCYVLIRRINGELDWRQSTAAIGVLMILPLSFAAGIHGQTYWTDDAADILSTNMEDNEDFLFVHDTMLGMHYLYTFHTHIEDVTERNITGHWRAPNSDWESELFSEQPIQQRGNLSSVKWVVLSPGIEWDSPPEGWQSTTEKADFMNGGGEWQVWSSAEVSFASET